MAPSELEQRIRAHRRPGAARAVNSSVLFDSTVFGVFELRKNRKAPKAPRGNLVLDYSDSVCVCVCVNTRYKYTIYRLQLKRGLFWYRNYPKLHEMVKYRSSRALDWTNRSGISRRVFFNSKKCWKMIIWSKKTQKCCFSWKKIFEKPHASHQICKKWKFRYNLIEFNQI